MTDITKQELRTISFYDENGNTHSFETSMSPLQSAVVNEMINTEIKKYKEINGIKGRHSIILSE